MKNALKKGKICFIRKKAIRLILKKLADTLNIYAIFKEFYSRFQIFYISKIQILNSALRLKVDVRLKKTS